jgi:hypothetical protein
VLPAVAQSTRCHQAMRDVISTAYSLEPVALVNGGDEELRPV